MRKVVRRAAYGLAVVFIFAGSALAENLISNGGFETGDFSGWTLSGNVSSDKPGSTNVITQATCDPPDLHPETVCVHGGTYAAEVGPIDSERWGELGPGYITQTVATTPGESYTLTFWLQHDGGVPNMFLVYYDGVQLNQTWNNLNPFPYTQFTYSGLVASGSTAELKFVIQQNPNYFRLDDVELVAGPASTAPVPEPGTMILLGSGLAGVIARRFRR